MATIVMSDFDFDDCAFERKMVEAAGIQFRSFSDARNRTPDEIIEHLKDADGAITSYGRYTAEVFDALPSLKVVSKTSMWPLPRPTVPPCATWWATAPRW